MTDLRTIDVKETVNTTERPLFIEAQGVDADAAYKRLSIIRRHMKELKAEINDTNTADVLGSHLRHYENLFLDMTILETDEEMLIQQGK
jgi:hypothetical protein